MTRPMPATAIGLDLWRRHRLGVIALGVCLGAASLANVAARGNRSWSSLAEAVGWALLALAVLCAFGWFHFTEGRKRGGFGSFPTRLFHMPVATGWLVAFPMVAGAMAVTAVYMAASWLLFAPLGKSPPILWPCLYLVSGITLFQTILWSLPESRYAKLLCLSVVAAMLTFGWMFFTPTIVEGTLEDWGYRGEPDRFLASLLVLLALTGPAAYGASCYRVGRQRHGKAERPRPRRTQWLDGILSSTFRRVKPFSKPASALLWHEWRQTGWILPMATGVLLMLTWVPSYLSQPLSSSATVGALCWMLAAPMLLGMILGRGFCKPDFWSPELRMAPYYAVCPVSPGQWVATKLRVAMISVLVTWAFTLYGSFLWTAFAGDWLGPHKWYEWMRFHYAPWRRSLLVALTPFVLILLTWRFLIGAMPVGLWGKRGWYYFSNAIIALVCVTLFVLVIWRSDHAGTGLALHALWPLVEWLPWVLGGAVVAKSLLACWAWQAALRRGLCSAGMIGRYFAGWTCATALLVAWVFVAISDVLWLRHLLLLAAMLAVPMAGPGLSMLALAQNRSRT